MPQPTYPFDITGLQLTNKIVGENQNLTQANAHPYRLIIPDFAPFHLDNLAFVKVDAQGNQTPLIFGQDYNVCLPYLAASRSIGKPIYGGFTINDFTLNGLVKITYQTVGGDWCANPLLVLEMLAELAYNPRITTWDLVTNVQEIFPPTNHDQEFDFVYGHQDLIASIDRVTAALISRPNLDQAALVQLQLDNGLNKLKIEDLQNQINILHPVGP